MITELKVQHFPLPDFPDRTRVTGRLPAPDGRRFSQWGETEQQARALAVEHTPGLTSDDLGAVPRTEPR